MTPFACPSGHTESLVYETARDRDGYIVRMRRCLECQAFWATREVLIDTDSYWSRAYSRNQARMALDHKQTRSCCKCGTIYRHGSYSSHVETDMHEASLMALERDRLNARRYAREWAQKRRVLDRAQ